MINQVTITDEAFPFDYDDVNQFNACLKASVAKENLAAIAEKVDEEEFHRIILDKLNEVSCIQPPFLTLVLAKVSKIGSSEEGSQTSASEQRPNQERESSNSRALA